ncbi:hypothetical protein GobsT_09370 [Gemmata obscuriglobus]|uniref:Uncharacterized protein n=1 Tax=Gemmata obscuriglobus TaxID=114 RepID=A0A2Z3HAK6_9BACT|nr:hypothetical protein [Gemmata obscuriglobus]AWM40547.1 hypothetical protein C1280_28575 [Gemmata obscuriglobus]QEG26198.1 hypothetical protein GobsT_09370 [Gemmata obscuriglobus]VTS00881.1 unnamed protein product [Gemmata obscuriglobus UQM 2246]
MIDELTTIREVDLASAEAILAVRLFIPGVVEGIGDEYPLARVPPLAAVITSRTVTPDGTETGTITTTGAVVVYCAHVDGQTADGRGYGFSKTVFIEGRATDAVAVHVSLCWTDRHGRRGSLDEELLVPWLGDSRREVAGGWVEARITPIACRADSNSAPNHGA